MPIYPEKIENGISLIVRKAILALSVRKLLQSFQITEKDLESIWGELCIL